MDDLQVLAHLITIRCEQCPQCWAVSLSRASLLNPHGRIPNCQANLFSHILVALLTFLGELFLWSQVKYDQKVPAWADEYALKSVFRKWYEILHYLSNVPLAGLPIPRHFAQAERGWVFTWRSDFLWNKSLCPVGRDWQQNFALIVGWDLLRVKTQLCWEHSQPSDFIPLLC